MLFYKKAFLVFCLMFVPAIVGAETGHNLRIVFHGTKPVVKDSSFGIAGCVVSPNVTQASDKWFAVIGPRYNSKFWWFEVMGGFIMQKGWSVPLIDIRASLIKFKPFTAWTNLQWVGLLDKAKDYLYCFLQTDYEILNIVNIGIETEDIFRVGEDMLSIGPHVVIPFKAVSIVAPFQFHKETANQVWFRIITNF
jgi:hypothetical protein